MVSFMTKEAKHTFDGVAADYERVRPTYPDALISDILTFSRVPADGRILEIGSGTGQATVPFARRGYAIDCVEHGADLCEIASQKFSDHPRVRVHCSPFEDWESPDAQFDLAISATAFHFIAPDIGYPKVARLLRPECAIAFFWTVHVPSYSEVFIRIREVYRSVAPELDDSSFDPYGWIQNERNTIDRTRLFSDVEVKTYAWTEVYDADRYVDLLATNSKHALLPEQTRNELFTGIRGGIAACGGSLAKIHLVALYLARKTKETNNRVEATGVPPAPHP